MGLSSVEVLTSPEKGSFSEISTTPLFPSTWKAWDQRKERIRSCIQFNSSDMHAIGMSSKPKFEMQRRVTTRTQPWHSPSSPGVKTEGGYEWLRGKRKQEYNSNSSNKWVWGGSAAGNKQTGRDDSSRGNDHTDWEKRGGETHRRRISWCGSWGGAPLCWAGGSCPPLIWKYSWLFTFLSVGWAPSLFLSGGRILRSGLSPLRTRVSSQSSPPNLLLPKNQSSLQVLTPLPLHLQSQPINQSARGRKASGFDTQLYWAGAALGSIRRSSGLSRAQSPSSPDPQRQCLGSPTVCTGSLCLRQSNPPARHHSPHYRCTAREDQER